jgi:hypothetical protein
MPERSSKWISGGQTPFVWKMKRLASESDFIAVIPFSEKSLLLYDGREKNSLLVDFVVNLRWF